MAKIISLFSHKGGVSKTTTTFNLGWALAELGRRVLIVDADPQCNLTGMVLGFGGDQDFEDFYLNQPRANLQGCLDPVFSGAQKPIVSAEPTNTNHENLFLLAGHIEFAENETQLAVAVSTGPAIPALQNLPGAMRKLLDLTVEKHGFDVVLVDMSPSVGTLNECLLMSSDYFIVPTSPDYFCDQAIRSLARVIPRWNSEIQPFRNQSLAYPIPTVSPVLLGIISQRYRPRSGQPSASFKDWIDRIKATAGTSLVPVLQALNMVVDQQKFKAAVSSDTPYNLANIADFNTLIAQSQKHSVPVFALSDAEIERVGVVLHTMGENRDKFRKVFTALANSVAALTGV